MGTIMFRNGLLRPRKRGLPNLKNTPEAIEVLKTKKNIQVLVKHGVLTEVEVASRYEINKHAYNTVLVLEGDCAVDHGPHTVDPCGY